MRVLRRFFVICFAHIRGLERHLVGQECVGWMENIHFENVEVDACEPIDRFSNYLTGDPVTGHFGAFELGSNIESVSFKNVCVKLNKEK